MDINNNELVKDASVLRTKQVGVKQWSGDYKYIHGAKWVRYVGDIYGSTRTRFTFFPIQSYGEKKNKIALANKVKKIVNDMLDGRHFYIDQKQLDINSSLTRNRIIKIDIYFLDNEFVDHLRFSITYKYGNDTSDMFIKNFLNAICYKIELKEKTIELKPSPVTELLNPELSINVNKSDIHHFKVIHNKNVQYGNKPLFKAYNNKIAYLDISVDVDIFKSLTNIGDTIYGITVKDMGTFEYIVPCLGGVLIEVFAKKRINKLIEKEFQELVKTDYQVLRKLTMILRKELVGGYQIKLDNLKTIQSELITIDAISNDRNLFLQFTSFLYVLDYIYAQFNKKVLVKPSYEIKQTPNDKYIKLSAGYKSDKIVYKSVNANKSLIDVVKWYKDASLLNIPQTQVMGEIKPLSIKEEDENMNKTKEEKPVDEVDEISALLLAHKATDDSTLKSVLSNRLKTLGYILKDPLQKAIEEVLTQDNEYICIYDSILYKPTITKDKKSDTLYIWSLTMLPVDENQQKSTIYKDSIDFTKISKIIRLETVWSNIKESEE